MTRTLFSSASALTLTLLSAPALAEDDPLVDVITISAPQTHSPEMTALAAEDAPDSRADAAALIARLPGGAAIANGALSGQAQYRGLSGERVLVRVNGQHFASGGPNLMDPPLQYAPPPLIEQIEMARGISPVRHGPGLAGGFNAVLKHVAFGAGPSAELSHDLSFGYRSADQSRSIGGLIGMATDQWRLGLLASHEAGDDLQTPLGRIHGSEHRRDVWGLQAGWRQSGQTLGFEYRRHETGATGNAPFAMDIRFIDTDFARATYEGGFGAISVRASLGWSDVAHAMNNFSLRPAPTMAMRFRETFAYADTLTAGISAAMPVAQGRLTLGADHATSNHDVRITNPNNASFFLRNLPDIEIRRMGVFAEWTGELAEWGVEAGIRLDQHDQSAGRTSTGSAVPMMPGMLAMAFNASDRKWDDVTVDAALRTWRPLNDETRLRFSMARKTRAPSYLERFAWLPTPASGGLADGNTYIGDLNLASETAWIMGAGLDWQGERAYVRPTLSWREIDNFIQGTPFDTTPGVINSSVEMVSNMNGDPTPLRFANVDARLIAADVDFGIELSPRWQVDGVLSLVDAKRTDISDDLYRIAPARLVAGLSHVRDRWTGTVEIEAVAEQNDVSTTNSERATPGYVLAHLRGHWQVSERVELSSGIENLLDHNYRQHLAGYNRNSGSDIGLNQRLPGAERQLTLRLTIRG